MKSTIFVTTAANRRDPIVLLNFQINYFLPPQMRAIFRRFYAQTHVCDRALGYQYLQTLALKSTRRKLQYLHCLLADYGIRQTRSVSTADMLDHRKRRDWVSTMLVSHQLFQLLEEPTFRWHERVMPIAINKAKEKRNNPKKSDPMATLMTAIQKIL
jgi:ABC-type lipopolysaccharide export system ATPase subunit